MKFTREDKNKLILGEIYTLKWGGCTVIFQYDKDINDKDRVKTTYIELFEIRNELKQDILWLTDRDIEVSSPEDKQWLLECIKNNKYIPKDKI